MNENKDLNINEEAMDMEMSGELNEDQRDKILKEYEDLLGY